MATITRVCLVGKFNFPQTCGALYVSKRHGSTDVILNKNVTLTNYKRGRGGRSSFSGIVATVFGATGFVGRYVVNRLGKCGSQVIIPYRGNQYEVDRMKVLGDLGQILFQPYHLKDEESLRKCMQYSNVVINLVGKDYETKNFSYEDVNVVGARNIARIAKECGVERFIHFSALNAANPQDHRVILKTGSRFLSTKFDGEEAVREEFPEATIMRPSDIVGEEGRFHSVYINKGRTILSGRWLQIWKKGEKTTKMPVLVDDVIDSVMEAVYQPETMGRNIDLVGPENLTLNEWLKHIFDCRGLAKYYIKDCHPKFSALMLTARINEWKYRPYNPLFTRDKLEREIISDKTVKGNLTLDDLGISPQSVKAKLAYLIRPKARINYHRALLGEEAPADLDVGPIPLLRAILVALMVWLVGRGYKAIMKTHKRGAHIHVLRER